MYVSPPPTPLSALTRVFHRFLDTMQLISAFVHSSNSIVVSCVNPASQEDVQEDWGWKLVHGEVFRTPNYPLVLSALVGNGAQLCTMVGVTLGMSRKFWHLNLTLNRVNSVFALLGFLSPSNRGSLATVMMICWTFFGRFVSVGA